MNVPTESWVVVALKEAREIPLDDCVSPPMTFQEGQERKIGEMTPFLCRLFTYLYRLQRTAAELQLQLDSKEGPHEMTELEEKLGEMMVRAKTFEAVFWSEVCSAIHLWTEPIGVRRDGEIVRVPRNPILTASLFSRRFPSTS